MTGLVTAFNHAVGLQGLALAANPTARFKTVDLAETNSKLSDFENSIAKKPGEPRPSAPLRVALGQVNLSNDAFGYGTVVLSTQLPEKVFAVEPPPLRLVAPLRVPVCPFT